MCSPSLRTPTHTFHIRTHTVQVFLLRTSDQKLRDKFVAQIIKDVHSRMHPDLWARKVKVEPLLLPFMREQTVLQVNRYAALLKCLARSGLMEDDLPITSTRKEKSGVLCTVRYCTRATPLQACKEPTKILHVARLNNLCLLSPSLSPNPKQLFSGNSLVCGAMARFLLRAVRRRTVLLQRQQVDHTHGLCIPSLCHCSHGAARSPEGYVIGFDVMLQHVYVCVASWAHFHPTTSQASFASK